MGKLAVTAFIINLIGRVLEWFGYRIFKKSRNDVLQYVPAEYLHILNDPELRDMFERSVDSFDDDITPFGRLMILERLKLCFQTRHRILELHSLHPSFSEVPLQHTVFNISQPRSGSTFLHRLLASGPGMYAPTMVELVYLAESKATSLSALRNTRSDMHTCHQHLNDYIEFTGKSVLDVAHVTRPDEADEMGGMMGFLTLDLFHVQEHSMVEYCRWLQEMPYSYYLNLYRTMKLHLQMTKATCLPDRAQDRPLLMKHHLTLLNLPALMEVFPDARFVSSYRDPAELVPSATSLGRILNRPYKGTWTRDMCHRYGRNNLELFAMTTQRYVEFRRGLSAAQQERFCDLDYGSLVREPLETARRVYRRLGLQWSDAAEDCMRRFVAQNPQHKHGRHRYSLQEYGLTAAGVRARFRDYIQDFNISINDTL